MITFIFISLNDCRQQTQDDFDDDIEDEHNILVFDNLKEVIQSANDTFSNNIAFYGSGDSRLVKGASNSTNFSGGPSKPDTMLESTTDASEWKLEVERVLPQLKVTIRPDNKVQWFRISFWMYQKISFLHSFDMNILKLLAHIFLNIVLQFLMLLLFFLLLLLFITVIIIFNINHFDVNMLT